MSAKRAHRGRPSQGISETMVRVRAPAALAEAVEAVATDMGISAAEVWRRAAVAWLESRGVAFEAK